MFSRDCDDKDDDMDIPTRSREETYSDVVLVPLMKMIIYGLEKLVYALSEIEARSREPPAKEG